MKTKFLTFLIACLLILIGCSKDNNERTNINSEPEFISINDNISSLPGKNFNLSATLEDPAGIKFINLKYDPWFLDKTIEKDSLPQTYILNYNFKVPSDAEMNSEHLITINSTNSGGKSTSKQVKVTLDLDVTNPTISIIRPANGATVLISDGDEINFDISVSDNKELAEFKIESNILNETKSITGESFDYIKNLNVDNTGTYVFTITVKDATGNTTSQDITVNVLDELKFDKMYITEVTDPVALTSDVFGIPALAEASSDEAQLGYVFTARYYAEFPNTEVRFIPQKTAFQPYTFGADPEHSGKLINGSGPDVNPIILPEIGYYEVTVNLDDFTYTVTPYTPTDDTYDFIQLIATGVKVNGESTCVVNSDGSFRCFHFTSGKELDQDPENPYRFTATVELFDEPDSEGNNGFILNSNTAGWGPFWRFDDASDPDMTVPGGGQNFIFTEEDFGTYNFVFDTHLNRVSITPIN